MRRIVKGAALFCLVSCIPLWPQQLPPSQTPGAKIIAELNDQLSQSLFDLRSNQLQEESKLCAGYEEPEMAGALLNPSEFIAIVVVTEVGLPDRDGYPPASVRLRVEQFLRGSSELRELQTANLVPHGARLRCGPGFGGHGFYFDEPKVGGRYFVAYSFLGSDRSKAYISGGIDLANYDQARETVDVKRFLNIEAMAGASNLAPFVTALTDPVPWFRGLAAERLIHSEACNDSPHCREALLSATRDWLQSSKYADRQQALRLTRLLTQPYGNEGEFRWKGISPIFNDGLRDLLRVAISDQYLFLGDQAYEQLESFDFYRSSPAPGECLVIYGELRKSVRFPAQELKDVAIRGQVACIPERVSIDQN